MATNKVTLDTIRNVASTNKTALDSVKATPIEKPIKATTKADKPKNTTTVNGRVKNTRWGRPPKNKDGKLVKDYCKTINVAVPIEILDQVNEYACQGRGVNLTDYINILIANDLEKNLSKYKKKIQANDFD